MIGKNVLVIGGAHMDRRGQFYQPSVAGASNPGRWIEEPGGGGFNAARNLSRLGHAVSIVSLRGGDADGETVAQVARAAGVSYCPITFLDRKTPSYTALLEPDGNLLVALADMDLYALFSPRRVSSASMRKQISASDLVLVDANFAEATVAAIAELTRSAGKVLAAIAISPAKVVRLRTVLPALHWLFMNEAEARALTGQAPATFDDWPAILRQMGLNGGVVTRGPEGALAFDADTQLTLVPPVLDGLRDVTGAGDALASGFLSGYLTGLSLSDCLKRGVAAAALTVRSPQAVDDSLTPAAVADLAAKLSHPSPAVATFKDPS